MRIARTGAGLSAATRFLVLARANHGDRSYALVRCDLETGRQHQIRVHLADIGCPVVGDKLYGPDPELFARGADQSLTADDHAVLELSRHALHARRFAFDHPITGERLAIEAPLPADLIEFWRRVSGELTLPADDGGG
jgi:23S rRNA pseudouridine1911/1915/1917 synthase